MAHIHQLNVSDGGVPKLPIESAHVGPTGLSGDRQRDLKHHGGPTRAVCLFGLDVIQRLNDEGHPIQPGTVGENVTVEGIDWSTVKVGTRFRFDGGVELEVTSWAAPCSHIRESFAESNFRRICVDQHPGEARAYAKVLTEGEIRTGEGISVE